MILPDLLARLQSQAIDCVTLLLIDLREGALIESCGDVADAGTVTRVMRELVAPRHEETILLSDDFTYVCQRLADPPHHAITAISRGTRSLGLIVGLLRKELR